MPVSGWAYALKAAGNDAGSAGKIFAGGSFWKRFEAVQNGVAKGYVVNYELAALPGLPEVRTVQYPDDNRAYFKKGDDVYFSGWFFIDNTPSVYDAGGFTQEVQY